MIKKVKIKKYMIFFQAFLFVFLMASIGFISVYEHFKNKAKLSFDDKVTNYAKIGASEIEKTIAYAQSVSRIGKSKNIVGEEFFFNYVEDTINENKTIKKIEFKNSKKEKNISFSPHTNKNEVIIKIFDGINITSVIIDMKVILEQITNRFQNPAGIDIFIIDETKKQSPFLLAFHKSRSRNNRQSIKTDINHILAKPYTKVYQNILEKQVSFVFKPANKLVSNEEILYSFLAGIIMSLLSLLIIYYMYNKNNQNKLIEKQIIKKTKDLYQSEERYRSLVESSPFAIVVCQKEEIIFANSFFLKLVGLFSLEEIKNKNIKNFFEEKEKLTQEKNKNQSKTIFYENKLKRKDNKNIIVKVGCLPVFYKNNLSTMFIIQDISKEKKAELRMIQNEKLASLGELSASITHELNQPLSIISMYADGYLMKAKKQKVTQKETTEKIKIISQQCVRMKNIINHMRGFSRKYDDKKEIFSPINAVLTSIKLCKKQNNDNNIKIKFLEKNTKDKNIYSNGIKVYLEQVIINMINNAKDSIIDKRNNFYEQYEGLIEIFVLFHEDTGKIEISIKDNGTGIDEQQLKDIFTPFFTTKDKNKGTGLGLSICYDIINKLGGEIYAKNKKDGAEFIITLPAFIKQTQSNDEPKDVNKNHILIAEDNKHMLTYLHQELVSRKYKVTVAKNGIDAYEKFIKDPADVIITDVDMPKLGGLGLIDKIKDISLEIPIIIISSNTELINKNYKNNIIIEKPFDIDILNQCLKKALKIG